MSNSKGETDKFILVEDLEQWIYSQLGQGTGYSAAIVLENLKQFIQDNQQEF